MILLYVVTCWCRVSNLSSGIAIKKREVGGGGRNRCVIHRDFTRRYLDSDTYIDTECGPCARNTIADSGQDGRGSIAKAVTDDAYTDDGGKGSGTRTDARTASVSATDTIADAYRKTKNNIAPGGTPGRLLCML